jgi:hypothetical protein
MWEPRRLTTVWAFTSCYRGSYTFIFTLYLTLTVSRFLIYLWLYTGSRKSRLTAVGIRCAEHATPPIRKKLALTSPTCGGRSVGIVRLRTKATEGGGGWLYTQSVGLLGRVISSSQGLYLNTGKHKHRLNAQTHTKHASLKWDSNLRSQHPSERRQFMT